MDPSDHDKRDQGNGPSGGRGPTHANGNPPGDEGWLRSVLENSSEVVKVVDPDGTLRYASPAFGRIFGHDPEEAVGTMNVLDHVHPDDLPRVLAESERALVKGKAASNRAEYRFRHADGSWRWVESVGTYLLDDPNVGGVVVSVRDVTWRKEAEERLQMQAQLLGALGEAVIALDADERVVHWNRAAEEMYGFSAEEIMGRRLMERVVPEDLRTHAEEVMAGVRAGLSWKGEFAARRRDGTPLTVETTNTPVLSMDGEQVRVVGVLRDVTERREAEAALRRSEAELFSVLESITDGFFAVDREWRFTYVNAQAEDLFFNARQDLIGEKLWEDPIFYPEYRRAVGEGATVRFEARYPPSGTWYSVRAYPSASGLSVYLQDITQRKEAEEALRESERRFRSSFDDAAVGMALVGLDGRFLRVNRSLCEILGYPPGELLEKTFEDVTHSADVRKDVEHLRRLVAGDTRTYQMEKRYLHKGGRLVWAMLSVSLVRDEGGESLYFISQLQDISERKLAEEALGRSEERYRTVVEQQTELVCRFLPDLTLTFANEAYARYYGGLDPEELVGRTFLDHVHESDHAYYEEELVRLSPDSPTTTVEERFFTTGGMRWLQWTDTAIFDDEGRIVEYQSVGRDVTERRALEERLEHQALHDPLTGLPNRRLFTDRLAHALEGTRRRDWGVAVLFMDLDDFKVVNDSLGHEAGDLLLTVVAQRLKRCLRSGDTLARFGGDEFVVLVDAVEGPGEAVGVAERVRDELGRPFVLEGRELHVSASVGISSGTALTKTPEDLLRDADTAMYRAKEDRGGFRVFDQAMHERVARRLDLESDLRGALERGELVLHYQPVIDLGDRGVWGTEALLRWDHPERGLLGPSDFVAVAEETGLIVPIGAWALEEACRQTKEWQEGHPRNPPLGVIVNLSANQLRHPGCEGAIRAALEGSGLQPGSLSLDVTETAFIEALEDNRSALERIRALGVSISIDDFGMGYSSLSYLKRLPADALKIDRSFLIGFGKDAKDTALVRMVIDVGHTLGMRVIAEGVEEWAQAALLTETGCDMAQGYHFSGPVPPEQVPGILGA